MSINIYRENLDSEKYVLVDYYLESPKNLAWAAWQLSCGQSMGSPNVRNSYETPELFEKHSCMIVGREEDLAKQYKGMVTIGFPIDNFDFPTDGVTQLLVALMGGELDIFGIEGCRVKAIRFPKVVEKVFKGPKYGLTKFREITGQKDKPFFGAIIKPKIGVSAKVLRKMSQELLEGGADFIKEDEIMSNPSCAPLEERLKELSPLLKDYPNSRFCFCINSDYPYVIDRAKRIAEVANSIDSNFGIHVNFWNGLGVYKSIRELDLPLFMHFQKSGDKILTDKTHRFGIDWIVLCQLIGMMGCDSAHVGMLGGYGTDEEEQIKKEIKMLQDYNVIPALSCGMHPALVKSIVEKVGNNVMLNCGGCVHGFPTGSKGGAMAMRQAVDQNYQEEYRIAAEKWG